MRSNSRSYLMEAENGSVYVVKFAITAHQRRTLINELLSCSLMRHLQICVPETDLIKVSVEILSKAPELQGSPLLTPGTTTPGIHFGSRLAVRPERVAIFDFLSDKLLPKVENKSDFLGALVFDLWSGKTDSRQAVFFRASKQNGVLSRDPTSPQGMFVQFVDQKQAFDGSKWHFNNASADCLYFRSSVYSDVLSTDSFQPWLRLIQEFPEEVIYGAQTGIPHEWIASNGDYRELDRMLELLVRRRSEIAQLLCEFKQRHADVFPIWR